MPKNPIDYSKTIIYKIVSGDYVYVGSTTDFKTRKCDHKKACNNEKNKNHNFKVYQMIRTNGGWENAEMTPIELFPCSSSIEARVKEEEWRKELQAEMNERSAFRTRKQHYQDNREEIIEKTKQYREEHREEIAEKMKQYYKQHREEISEKHKQTFTCECGSICRINEKSRHFKSLKHQTFMHK